MNDDAIKINPEDAEAYIEKSFKLFIFNIGLSLEDLEK